MTDILTAERLIEVLRTYPPDTEIVVEVGGVEGSCVSGEALTVVDLPGGRVCITTERWT